MKSHVYLLAHRNGRRFKIGKANDIIQRARSFGLDEIDWNSSIGLEVQGARAALLLERILLQAFEGWRLSAEEVAADNGMPDGATEWVRSDCRWRVDLLLAQIEDIFPYSRITGEALNRQVKERTAPVLELAARRVQKKLEASERKERRVIRQKAADHASREALEAALLLAKAAFWKELEHQINTGSIVGMAAEGHGWTLLLLSQSVNERIWQLGLQETQFSWPNGGGGLVSSISSYQRDDIQVCAVHLGRSFYDGWPIPEIVNCALADVTQFLRYVPLVEIDKLKTTLEVSPSSEAWPQDAYDGLNAFVDKHLPILQSRHAARMSLPLF